MTNEEYLELNGLKRSDVKVIPTNYTVKICLFDRVRKKPFMIGQMPKYSKDAFERWLREDESISQYLDGNEREEIVGKITKVLSTFSLSDLHNIYHELLLLREKL